MPGFPRSRWLGARPLKSSPTLFGGPSVGGPGSGELAEGMDANISVGTPGKLVFDYSPSRSTG